MMKILDAVKNRVYKIINILIGIKSTRYLVGIIIKNNSKMSNKLNNDNHVKTTVSHEDIYKTTIILMCFLLILPYHDSWDVGLSRRRGIRSSSSRRLWRVLDALDLSNPRDFTNDTLIITRLDPNYMCLFIGTCRSENSYRGNGMSHWSGLYIYI